MRQRLTAIVNGIPTVMMLDAKVPLADWRLWNQFLVVLGKIVGGFVFSGPVIYAAYKPASASNAAPLPMPTRVPAE